MLTCPAKDTIHPWGLSLAYVSMVVKRVDVHLINKSMDSQVTSELFVIFPKEWPIKKGNNWLIPFVITNSMKRKKYEEKGFTYVVLLPLLAKTIIVEQNEQIPG